MLVNNSNSGSNSSNNMDALVKEFNKFQVQESKEKGPVGYLRRLGKTVRKFVFRSEYKKIKNQLSRELIDLQLIKYDNESIRDRKKPAKTKDILNAIEHYKNSLKVHQEIKNTTKRPSVNDTSSFVDKNANNSLPIQQKVDKKAFLESLSLWESKQSGNELRQKAAAKIREVVNLQANALDLSGCELSEIPEPVFDMVDLEVLIIKENNIKYLPDKFDKLPNLKVLDCYKNDISKFPESLICHANPKFECIGLHNIGWTGLRENFLKRDTAVLQGFRKRHINEDGTVDYEQGPIFISPKAMEERKYWVYNEEPQAVFRGAAKTPQEVLNEGGIHIRSLATEGIAFHVNANASSGSKLTGGAVSTSTEFETAARFARTKSGGFVYKIDLEPQQGVDVVKTLKAVFDSGNVQDAEELEELGYAQSMADMENEMSVIGSISPSQISVLDNKTDKFIPINEWVDLNR